MSSNNFPPPPPGARLFSCTSELPNFWRESWGRPVMSPGLFLGRTPFMLGALTVRLSLSMLSAFRALVTA